MYGWGRYGLAGDYYSLLAQANLENCDPMDSACVSNNVAKQAAVEDLWVSKYMTQPGGAPDDLKLNFTDQTTAQVREFYNPADLFNSGNVVDTRGILTVGTGGKTTAYVPPSAAPPPLATIPKPQSGNHTLPALVPANDWGQSLTNVFQPAGSIFSAVPWWGWLGGAGLALFALKGGR